MRVSTMHPTGAVLAIADAAAIPAVLRSQAGHVEFAGRIVAIPRTARMFYRPDLSGEGVAVCEQAR